MYIDIHCHLDYPIFRPRFADVIRAARKADVLICTAGIDLASNQKAAAFAKKFENIECFLGVYPRYWYEGKKDDMMTDKEYDQCIAFMKEHIDDCIGIGEIGLDFSQNYDQEMQEKNFLEQVNLAIKWNKPVVVHSRKAEERCIELLEQSKIKKVIMHCFSGPKKLLKRIIANGWYVTIPTSVVRATQFEGWIKETPIDQLFAETDSPYLSPFRDKPNQPAFVLESYKKIAELKKTDIQIIKDQLFRNYLKITSQE